jgi:glycerophosphoryl diester phosphodiesterase
MSDVLSWVRMPGPLVIGHRGFPSAARENTLASFEAALEAGCDGVELDVRMTGDGVLVVHHDETLKIGGGSVRIESTSWSELEELRTRDVSASPPVCRLAEALESLRGRGLINVEGKPPGRGRHDAVADALAAALERIRPRESLLVSSFDLDLLGRLARRDRSLLLGFLFSSRREMNHLDEHEAADGLMALHPRHDIVDKALTRRAQERGWILNTWTVDDRREAERLAGLGVCSLITNRPDLLAGIVHPPDSA